MDEGLFEVAQQRAAELAVLFDHTRPNGSSYSSILPDYQGMNGENIAGSYTSAESVMKGWMNSSGHKRNILMSSFTSIGIGCFYHNNRYHWVQCFSSGGSKEMTTYPQNETKQVSIELLGGATTYSVRDEYKTVAVGEDIQSEYNIKEEEDIKDLIEKLTNEMVSHAQNLEFEKAAELRDKIKELESIR